MPQEEQFEFPEVREEKKRGRVRRHMERVRPLACRRRLRRGRATAARGAEPGAAPAPSRDTDIIPERQEQPLADVSAVAHTPAVHPEAPVAEDALASAQGDGPAPKRRCLRPDEPLVPRCLSWGRVTDGRPLFMLARTHDRGELKAITVTCNMHRTEGQRCHKSLSLGSYFTEEEATRRIKEWCVAGMALQDGDGARQCHMDPEFFNPRTVPAGELRSDDDLNALVA